MKERIQAILDRELQRLQDQSHQSGLDLNDFKKLDLLIKAHRSFTTETPPPFPLAGSDNSEPAPSSQTTEQLLADIAAFSPAK